MLWRKGYETRRVDGFVAPIAIDLLVAVGLSRVEQVTDAELWMKLLDKDFPKLEWGLLSFGVELGDVMPGSRLKRVRDMEGDWGVEREFCYCPAARLMMVGPPTEDAWEDFANAVRLSALGE